MKPLVSRSRWTLRGWFLLLAGLLFGTMTVAITMVWLRRAEHRASRMDIETDWKEVEAVFDAQGLLTILYTSIESGTSGTEAASQLEREALEKVTALAKELERRATNDRHGLQVNEGEVAAAGELRTALERLADAIARGERLTAANECAHAMSSLGRYLRGTYDEVDEALEELRRHEAILERTATAGFAALLGLLIAAGIFLALRVVRPLRVLRRLAGQLGERHFAIATMPPAAGEIDDLAVAFTNMARELGTFTAELEQRVAVRTAELVRSRAQLRLMLENIPDAVGLLRPDGVVLDANGAYRRLFGDTAQPDHRDDLERTAQGYRRWRLADGTWRLLDLHRFHAQDPEALTLEYARDMTEAAEIEAALSATRQLAAIGGLSTAVAHEINNPLTAIGACAEGLLERRSTHNEDPTEREYLELIVREVYRCKGITERLLDVFRGTSPRLEPVALRPIAEDCVRIVAVLAERRGVRIAIASPQNDIVETNADAVRQIIVNLLMNAVQASEPGGRVYLEIMESDADLALRVRDEGRGISPSVLPNLFEPLRSDRRDRGGVGIGLYLVRVLTEALRGSVSATSCGEGHGSTFTVTLPRTVTARTEPEEQSAP